MPEPLKRPKIKFPKPTAPHIFQRGMQSIQSALMSKERSDMPGPKPPWLVATLPEWYCFWALERLGKKPGIHFQFQSSIGGGRLYFGGAVVDFLILDPASMAINIQGEYWHSSSVPDRMVHDAQVRAMIEAKGIRLVYIDEKHILKNPMYYVKEALRGVDHSRDGGA